LSKKARLSARVDTPADSLASETSIVANHRHTVRTNTVYRQRRSTAATSASAAVFAALRLQAKNRRDTTANSGSRLRGTATATTKRQTVRVVKAAGRFRARRCSYHEPKPIHRWSAGHSSVARRSASSCRPRQRGNRI